MAVSLRGLFFYFLILKIINFVMVDYGYVIIDFLIGSDFLTILKWYVIGKVLDFILKKLTE
mgnify:CR=1 FL=1